MTSALPPVTIGDFRVAPPSPLRRSVPEHGLMIISSFRNRPGFTMIEALMVVVMAGAIFAIAAPRVSEANERAALRTSRQMLASAFGAARAAAVQKGQVSTLTITSSSATVTVLNGLAKTSITVFGPVRFDESVNTTITPLGNAPATVTYDVRGMASPRLDVIARYQIKSASYADTLCVSSTGFILQKDCKL